MNVYPFEPALHETAQQAREAEKGGQPGLAAIRLYELIERRGWQAGLWERVGLAQVAKGDDERAIHDLGVADAAGTLSLAGRVALAQAFERTGQYEQAVAQWKQVAAAAPSPGVYEHLAYAYREAGQMQQVVTALRRWQELDPLNPFIAYRLGLDLATLAPDESLAQLDEAARLDDRYTSALEALRTAFALSNLSEDEGYRLTVVGRALAGLGEWELAEAAFAGAVQRNPDYAEAWAFLGEARLQTGQEGLADLNKALEVNPRSVLAHVMMALYWGRQEAWEQAIEQMQAVVSLEPQRSIWQVELGNLYAQQGDLVAARTALRQAVEMDPRSGEVWRALAQFSLVYQVDLEDIGLPAARTAIALDEKDARAHDLAGAILATLGEAEAAKAELEEALDLDANLPEVNYHLGSLYLQQLDMDAAYDYLSRAAELDPTGATGELARRLLEKYFNVETNGSNSP